MFRVQVVLVVPDVVVQGPAQGAGARLQVENAFKQAVEGLLHEGIHMMMVVADGATRDLNRHQCEHRQPGSQARAEEKQACIE